MGKLYCICDKADEEVCKDCINNIMFKPDVKACYPGWPRTFDLRKVALYKQIQSMREDDVK